MRERGGHPRICRGLEGGAVSKALPLVFSASIFTLPAMASEPWWWGRGSFEQYSEGEHTVSNSVRCGPNAEYEFKLRYGTNDIAIVGRGRGAVQFLSASYSGRPIPDPLKKSLETRFGEFSRPEVLKMSCGGRENIAGLPSGGFLLIEISGPRSCFTAEQKAAFERGADIRPEHVSHRIEWHQDSIFTREPPLEPCVAQVLSRPAGSIAVP